MLTLKSTISSIMLAVLIFLISCAYSGNFFAKSLRNDIYLYDLSGNEIKRAEASNQIPDILARMDNDRYYPELDILTPHTGTIFPRDIASPKFMWSDEYSTSTKWLVTIGFKNNDHMVCLLTDKNEWIPGRHIWELIKANSLEKEANVTIIGIRCERSLEIRSRSSIVISTSKDQVGTPIFYKQVPPNFAYAYKHPELSRWLLGDISSYGDPPIVLERLPVCGNCHSFSRDGKIFGMDIDYRNDKGAYVITPTREGIELSGDDFITWNEFPKPQGTINMGLFSRISPDGNYVVSTVNEKNFMALIRDLDFSQLFFTTGGIIAYYSRIHRKFASLPGADNPHYVQTSPGWSPDGRYIVFSRAKASSHLLQLIDDYKTSGIGPEERIDDLNEKYQIQYDLYRVPFNDGNGGVPEPVNGASNNSMSNYCARYSPDGKWIVFNQSKTGLLLQPDSQLYIIPAEGGTARKMRCNTDIMNSWHSWSPNSRWLVFASKINSPFTELFLTHVDQNGNDSPPVLLWRLNSKEYAATIPEFINVKKGGPKSIKLSLGN